MSEVDIVWRGQLACAALLIASPFIVWLLR